MAPRVSTTKSGGQHIATRFKKHGAGGERQSRTVMNIRFGYRSLIDWASSPAWTYNMGERANVGQMTDQQRAANPWELTAPGSNPNIEYGSSQRVERITQKGNSVSFSGKFDQITTSTGAGITSVPETWMGKGPKAAPGSKYTIGGSASIGAAWNVANPVVPNLSGVKNARKAFGHHVPQWLYRLAEIGRHGSMNISNLMSEIRGGVGPIGIKQQGGKDMTGSEEGFGVQPGVFTNPNRPQMGGFGKGSWMGPFSSEGTWHSGKTTAWKLLPQLKNKSKNYTTTFTENVYDGLSSSIPVQMAYLKRAMFASEGTNIAQSDVVRAMQQHGEWNVLNDPEGPGGEAMFGTMGRVTEAGHGAGAISQTGGQTHQEKMSEIAGLGTARESGKLHVASSGVETSMVSPMGQWGGSNPVDVEFHNAQRATRNSPQFFRADMTTQTYQKGGHHGIGLTMISAPLEYNQNQVMDMRRIIVGEQEIARRQWNYVIRALKELEYGTGGGQSGGMVRGSTLDPVAMRRKLAAEHFPTVGVSGGYAYQEQAVIEAESGIARSKADVEAILETELRGISADTMNHVLHSLGVFMSGSTGVWANIMPIDLVMGGVAEQGTLIITYDFDDEGYFNEITLRDVHIQEGSVERWIFDNRNQTLGIATEQQLRDMANESMAVEAYAGVSGVGTLHAAVDTGSSRIYQTAHMAMPIPGALSGILDQISMGVILQLGEGMQENLSSNIVNEAVRYSKQMRNPSQMSDIPDWINAFAQIFLDVPATVADVTSAQGGNDPFWYLWAAPYVSTMYPQLSGGGLQDSGQ